MIYYVYADVFPEDIAELFGDFIDLQDLTGEQLSILEGEGMAIGYSNIKDFITAFNKGEISDEGFLANKKK